jgi:hypothetical protein
MFAQEFDMQSAWLARGLELPRRREGRECSSMRYSSHQNPVPPRRYSGEGTAGSFSPRIRRRRALSFRPP